MSDTAVLFETLPAGGDYAIGVATLNAEKSLNSLTLDMADALAMQLRDWDADDRIACVVLCGAGEKAFCAGGDVVRLYESAVNADGYAQTFFEREYRLDYQIHRYTKPMIVWGHGIVMGGGLGLLAGASHRVVTEKTRMAMPEVGIGLYPDVGGSWFLNRMPGRVGLFLALTGASINARDAIFVGLADHALANEQYASVLAALQQVRWSGAASENAALVDQVLVQLEAQACAMPEGKVRENLDTIQKLTVSRRLPELVAAITGYQGEDDWFKRGAEALRAGCPASIRLIVEMLAKAKHLSLREVFQLELGVSTQCVALGNFREGVRALLIDKDRQPHYPQPTLDDITDKILAAHFAAPWGDAPHPLADL